VPRGMGLEIGSGAHIVLLQRGLDHMEWHGRLAVASWEPPNNQNQQSNLSRVPRLAGCLVKLSLSAVKRA